MARIFMEQVSLTLAGRLVPLSLAGLGPGWCEPAPVRLLSELDLSLDDGDRLAVVGCPGAGKTMFLRLLAGHLAPTAGRCSVAGSIVDLVDPEKQLDPNASGQQHLERLTKTVHLLQARAAADLARLGDLLTVPVKYYSPGMCWRLAFAMATARPADVVLADQAVSRSDLAFQAVAERRLAQLLGCARAAVLVEHDLTLLARLCNKAVWLERGVVRQLGAASVVLRAYQARQDTAALLADAS